jgi:hypothetical protein
MGDINFTQDILKHPSFVLFHYRMGGTARITTRQNTAVPAAKQVTNVL